MLLAVLFIVNYERPSLFQAYSKLQTADQETYEELLHGSGWGYVKDKNSVHFYLGDGKNGYKFNELPGVDSDTFRLLGEHYGVDNNRVYWGWEIIEQADSKTFEVYFFPSKRSDFKYAKDANHFYRSREIVSEDTEELFIETYFTDANMSTHELIK